MVPAGIDDPGAAGVRKFAVEMPVFLMHMPMDHIGRMIGIQQIRKAGKALMAEIFKKNPCIPVPSVLFYHSL